jgi:hypothetical protein
MRSSRDHDDETAIAQLAHHWSAARGQPARFYDRSGGDRSVYAYADARVQYERALDLWDEVPDATERAAMSRVG